MKITFTGKQVDISDRLRAHIEENVLNAVTKYFSDPIGCNVAFSKEGDDFSAEVTVHPAKNIVLKGTGLGSDPYTAFDNANSHIVVRLSKHKNRLKDHKSKTSLSELASEAVFPVIETDEEMDIDVNAPLTIAETGANIPVCSVSEAVMYMDLANECALMFRNANNNHISMVYRRNDRNIGWVEPKADK